MADQQALDEVVPFTSDLIRIDTTNHGGGDCQERPAAEYAAALLAEAGLEPTLLERTKGRTNVVARIEGTDPSADALLLHGHLDVVPARADDWSVHPFSGEIRDGVVWGRGAVDMKNMDAMILAVVRDWARAGRPAPARHRDRVHRRRGGQRRGRRRIPGRRAPGAVRGVHRRASASPGRSPSTTATDDTCIPSPPVNGAPAGSS